MSLKKMETIEVNRVELEISVDAETFKNACMKAYKKNVAKFAVPGFRKGKAPKKYIESLYGTGVFYEDAIDDTYGQAYEEALAEAKIIPVGRPEMNITDIGDEGYTFSVKVYTKPEITVKSYKGLKAEYVEPAVSDADVAEELERRRQHNAQLVPVEREAKEGDTAVIDYEGFCDGVAFEGGKGENHELKLGSGQFIPGFEEQLVGKKAGDACDVNVTFPDPYHSAELAGKPAVFKVTVKEVKESIAPELDDEFAKDISEFETLAELSESIRTRLLEYRTRTATEGFEGALIEQVIENIEGEIPACMYDDEVDKICQDYAYRLQAQGLKFEDYLSMTGMDMDAFRKTMLPQAEKRVKTTLAMEAIAKAEAFEITDADCDEEIKKLAEEYKMPEEEVRKYIEIDVLKSDLANKKAMELIKETAEKTAPAAKKPAAKKSTAKKAAPKAEEGEAAPAEEKKPAAKKPAAKKTTAKKTEEEKAE
ncbi:MAG: trigger factor [Clostridia bacterium]|nr:trigger factor [Clostridia bacterium]